VTFKFADATETVLSLAELPEGIVRKLALHGLSQKAGDSYAGVKGDVNQAKTNVQEVFDNLKNGVWGSSGGGGGPRLMDLAEAIAEIKGKQLAEVLEAVKGVSDEQRKAWRAHPAIKTKIAEIALRKAQASAAGAGELQLNI
jgi:hypothetical protein